MRNCAEVVRKVLSTLWHCSWAHEAGCATHRVSFDVSSEEGMMYTGVPVRRTREHEQMDAHTLCQSASTVNWYTIAPRNKHTYRHLGDLCGYSI